MNRKKRCQAAALFCGLVLIAQQALAHGDAHSKNADAPIVKEQKAWGIAGDPKPDLRTIRFTMSDRMRFDPDRLTVQEGETVRFLVRNNGRLMHEFVIGTKKEHEEHAALMKKFPNMEHDEPYMAHVKPGKTGEIVWTFNRAGEFDFACLIAGHYDAGMVGKIKVVSRNASMAHQAQDSGEKQ